MYIRTVMPPGHPENHPPMFASFAVDEMLGDKPTGLSGGSLHLVSMRAIRLYVIDSAGERVEITLRELLEYLIGEVSKELGVSI